ncbi:MAG: hypothetical protein LBW77_05540, partial [Verrucomicrobiota bacterium]|nr:hypothetical protein [Verrucomicrobiota bacterium]
RGPVSPKRSNCPQRFISHIMMYEMYDDRIFLLFSNKKETIISQIMIYRMKEERICYLHGHKK